MKTPKRPTRLGVVAFALVAVNVAAFALPPGPGLAVLAVTVVALGGFVRWNISGCPTPLGRAHTRAALPVREHRTPPARTTPSTPIAPAGSSGSYFTDVDTDRLTDEDRAASPRFTEYGEAA